MNPEIIELVGGPLCGVEIFAEDWPNPAKCRTEGAPPNTTLDICADACHITANHRYVYARCTRARGRLLYVLTASKKARRRR